MPYFDYCSTLLLYSSKKAIQIIANCYNFCLFKLFKIDYYIGTSADYNKLNNILESYGIFTFQHRVISRIIVFAFKIVHNNSFPVCLKNQIIINNENPIYPYGLRGINKLRCCGKEEENTFYYYFSQIINKFCIDDLKLPIDILKIRVENNINVIFLEFVKLYEKFDLKHKTFTSIK